MLDMQNNNDNNKNDGGGEFSIAYHGHELENHGLLDP